MQKEYKSINKSVRKKDAMQLLTGGKPVYTDDVTPSDALVLRFFALLMQMPLCRRSIQRQQS